MSPVIYDSVHAQSFQVLNSGKVILIVRPSKDDLGNNSIYPLSNVYFEGMDISIVNPNAPDHSPWQGTTGWGP